MDYQNLVADFVQRTQDNLRYIESVNNQYPERGVNEVTQLINSLLGLIILPFEEKCDCIPIIPFSELEEKEWFIPTVAEGYLQPENLNELIQKFRNAVAHFNIKFISDEREHIKGICVWNERNGEIDWQTEMNIQELKKFVDQFTEFILETQNN